ncbi:MAG: UvrD-helicase domain-containing protein [Bacilli bacterium]|nr:UvrD-helicase domain-containing protein [Bacilli bacterium]
MRSKLKTMDYRSLLNDAQFRAVETKSQYVRIVAGAGSGKTRVLTYRISYLMEMMDVLPSHILAIAFTNKVAAEMKQRVLKMNPQFSNLLQISTFHSFCAKFLRQEHNAFCYPIGFTIYDEEDQKTLIKNIGADMGLKKSDAILKAAISYISSKKGSGKYPEDITIRFDSFEGESKCLEIYREYERRKTENFGLDFDDLLNKTVQILENNPSIRYDWANRFDHILVDEFQDTNDIQYYLLKLLMRPDSNLYVVGDPDQTIYTWRGANQKIMLDFNRNFANAETIILNQNYRSTKNILNAANKLIAYNKKRVPKDLFTNEPGGDPVICHKFVSPEDEANWVCNKIQRIKDIDGTYKNIAVLFRSSYVTRPFERVCAMKGIKYAIYGGLRFYQRREIKDVLAYFRLLVNEKDDVAFERIANVPRRGVSDESLELLQEEAQKAGLSCYEYVRQMEPSTTALKPRVATSLKILVDSLDKTKEELAEGSELYSSILKRFITSIGYFDYISKEEDIDEDRVGNVNSLFDDVTHYIDDNPDSTFDQYLQNVSLLTSQDEMNGGDSVSFMTVHIAKGLEFDYVFIICMSDQVFPSPRALLEVERDGAEEERRLAYVAMTRAKKNLYVTCNTSFSYVTGTSARPSQYYKEAGLEFPASETGNFSNYGGGYGGGYRPSGGGGYRQGGYNNNNSQQAKPKSYFSDGEAISQFDESKPKIVDISKKVENVSKEFDWKVGDIVLHEKFGEGTVLQLIDSKFLIVKFDEGQKLINPNNKAVSKKASKGGQA